MRIPGIALLIAVSVALACDSGTDPSSDAPAGVAITLNGTVVARTLGSTVEGGIHVHYGEYSGLFVVEVLNDDGRPLSVDPELQLEASVADGGLAGFVPTSPGAFRGEFEMFAEGVTTIAFRLVRTGTGTAEWTSAPVELRITAC